MSFQRRLHESTNASFTPFGILSRRDALPFMRRACSSARDKTTLKCWRLAPRPAAGTPSCNLNAQGCLCFSSRNSMFVPCLRIGKIGTPNCQAHKQSKITVMLSISSVPPMTTSNTRDVLTASLRCRIQSMQGGSLCLMCTCCSGAGAPRVDLDFPNLNVPILLVEEGNLVKATTAASGSSSMSSKCADIARFVKDLFFEFLLGMGSAASPSACFPPFLSGEASSAPPLSPGDATGPLFVDVFPRLLGGAAPSSSEDCIPTAVAFLVESFLDFLFASASAEASAISCSPASLNSRADAQGNS
mmetsp:Transcript_56979/g.185175  ORF Transcript_56979/g.185175 Transcript_56979/m.185175 type:complete len:302 (-) Transcript_56979:796-1701(-)